MCISLASLHLNNMAPKRGSSSISTLDSVLDDAASLAGASDCTQGDGNESLATFLKKRRLVKAGDDTIEGMKLKLEEENFLHIFQHMAGKLDAQALCIKMIKAGKFTASKNQKSTFSEPRAATSTNKFHMLSIENWSDILFMLAPEKFPKELALLGSKAWLCSIGCLIGGLYKDSAIPSRLLRVIAETMKARADQIFGSRYDLIVIVADEAGSDLVNKHDFTKDPGCFYAEYTEENFQAGFIHHRGTAKHKVPIPADFKGKELTFLDNHCEHMAALQGSLSDPLMSRIFHQSGIELPKLFSRKRSLTIKMALRILRFPGLLLA